MHSQEQGQTKTCGCAAGAACGCDAKPKAAQLDAPGAQTQMQLDGVVSRKIMRNRDGNGVAEGAESAVDQASGSSGFALPNEVRSQFEDSLGADLSGVRVHTGSDSVAAASAVGARAYTYGQDIHFNAGQFDAGSDAGRHLLAHEVAHTVQQSAGGASRQYKLEVSGPSDAAEVEADSAADAMVAGRAATVSFAGGVARKAIFREPNWLGGFSPLSQKQPDMTALDWMGDVKPTNHDELSAPSTRTVGFGAVPPPPAPITKNKPANVEPPCPSCHTPNEKPFGGGSFLDDMEKEQLLRDREKKWNSYQYAVADGMGAYNNVVPLITNYQTAAKDPALADVDKFSGVGADDNLHVAANNQKVGPADTKVNDVFNKKQIMGTKLQVSGTDVDVGKKGDKAADDINKHKDEGVRKAKAAVEQSEGQIKVALGEVNGIKGDIKEKTELLMAKMDGVHKVEAKGEENEAKEKVDTIEEDKAAAKEKLKAVTGVMEGVAGILKGVGEMHENPVGGVGEMIEGSAKFVDVIGEQVINSKYEDKLKSAKSAFSTAKAKVFKITRNIAESELAAAETALDTAINRYSEVFLEKLKLALKARRTAYQDLSTAVGSAAKANGADTATANKMAAAVAAVPVVETVVGRLRAIPETMHMPAGEYDAKVGYHMAKNAGDGSVKPFIDSLSDMAGYAPEYSSKIQFWEKRLTSMQAFIAKMGNV